MLVHCIFLFSSKSYSLLNALLAIYVHIACFPFLHAIAWPESVYLEKVQPQGERSLVLKWIFKYNNLPRNPTCTSLKYHIWGRIRFYIAYCSLYIYAYNHNAFTFSSTTMKINEDEQKVCVCVYVFLPIICLSPQQYLHVSEQLYFSSNPNLSHFVFHWKNLPDIDKMMR